MRRILKCMYIMIICFLLRALFLFVAYSKLVYRFWPVDSILYAYEVGFFVLCIPFWFVPFIYLLKRNKGCLDNFLLVSYLPEIVILIGLFIFFVSHWIGVISWNALLFVYLPLMLLVEVSFFLTRCLVKKCA